MHNTQGHTTYFEAAHNLPTSHLQPTHTLAFTVTQVDISYITLDTGVITNLCLLQACALVGHLWSAFMHMPAS